MFAQNLALKKIGFQSSVYFTIMEKEFGIYTIHYDVTQRIQWGGGKLLRGSVCEGLYSNLQCGKKASQSPKAK